MKKTYNKKKFFKASVLFLSMSMLIATSVFFVPNVKADPLVTDYEFGDWRLLTNNINQQQAPILYKNGTGDYWYRYSEGSTDYFLQSDNNQDYLLKSETHTQATYLTGSSHATNVISYDNKMYTYYMSTSQISNNRRWGLLNFNNTATSVNVFDIYHSYVTTTTGYSFGGKMSYFNGQWYTFLAYSTQHNQYLSFRSMDNPSSTSFTSISTLTSSASVQNQAYYSSVNPIIYNGSMYMFYRPASTATQVHVNSYDGISISGASTIVTDARYARHDRNTNNIGGMGVCFDHNNNQLFMAYVDTDGDLVYRVSNDPMNTWSDKTFITNTTGEDGSVIQHVESHYIDGRIVVTFSSDAHTSGVYKNYYVTSPCFTDIESGATDKFNVFSWDDASPGDTNLNTSVFVLNNTYTRDIENITWHVGDIGDIPSASNVNVWSNMSGSWVAYLVGVDQNTSTIDISVDKAGGGEWTSGEKLYWKFEIEEIASDIDETTHIVNYDMYYWVTLTPEA